MATVRIPRARLGVGPGANATVRVSKVSLSAAGSSTSGATVRIASARVGVGPGAAGARVVISRLRLGVQAAAVANLRAYAWDPIGKVSRPVRVYAWDPASKTATLLAGVIPTGGGGGSGGGTGGGGATSGGYPGAYPAHYPPPATGTGGLPSGAGFDLDGFDMDGWL